MPPAFQTCSLASWPSGRLVIEILELVVQCQHVELFSSEDSGPCRSTSQAGCCIFPPREKTCTSPFGGAGGSACRALTEQRMRGTSSAFVIEQPLHL